jgi:hypothetical protein
MADFDRKKLCLLAQQARKENRTIEGMAHIMASYHPSVDKEHTKMFGYLYYAARQYNKLGSRCGGLQVTSNDIAIIGSELIKRYKAV